jgi:hypothetical protein
MLVVKEFYLDKIKLQKILDIDAREGVIVLESKYQEGD